MTIEGQPGEAENRQKIRYAVVGHIAQNAVLPAFAHAENSTLAALVSGNRAKLERLEERYGVPHTYTYDQFTDCLESGKVDAVYIAVPDSKHAEFSIRAALAHIHVLCEKPMAESVEDCRRMMEAARDGGVRLMIAYRLHFEAANLEAIEIARSGALGELRTFHSVFTQSVAPGNIRLKRETGRGPLYDMGVYCINAARHLFGDEPIEASCVNAGGGDERFREVPETVAATLLFPGGRVATFTCGFGSAAVSEFRLVGTRGDLRLDPAYNYSGELRRFLTIDGNTDEKTFDTGDQFAPELIHFSECILHGSEPGPSGAEGLADVRVIEALARSAETRRSVRLRPAQRPRRPSRKQQIDKPAVEEPPLVKAKPPAGTE